MISLIIMFICLCCLIYVSIDSLGMVRSVYHDDGIWWAFMLFMIAVVCFVISMYCLYNWFAIYEDLIK
jgi:Na+-driven multidrug efflux pump